MSDADSEIDRLYQLPLDAFTSARNDLAKRLNRPTVKDLQKPSVAAWAVNQLYWQHRPTYDRLTKASDRLRAEHRKLLAGKASDIRDAETAHREAVGEAGEKVKGVLTAGGETASPATMMAVTETLQSLPGADAPGRLSRPLKPMGFEALAGVGVRPSQIPPNLRVVETPAALSKRDVAREKQREKEEKERQHRAEKERREAQAEVARTEAVVKRARAAVEQAEAALETRRGELAKATTAQQRARLRARG